MRNQFIIKRSDEKGNVLGVLFIIILVAFMLRTFPYANHYPLLVSDDAMRDFQQVQYIQDNHQINWREHYGTFFSLHLIVYLTSEVTGISAWQINLFIPQMISSFGVIFLYLFLRRHVEEKYALLSAFFLATFGPNIWWAAQPVRETIGLFFFSFLLFVFGREINNPTTSNKFSLFLVMCTMAVTHYWTSFIILGTLLFLMPITYFKLWKKCIMWILLFCVIILAYWTLKFQFVFELLEKGGSVGINRTIVPIFSLLVILGMLVFSFRSKKDRLISGITLLGNYVSRRLNRNLSNVQLAMLFAYLICLFVGFMIFNKLMVFNYPPQQFLSLILLGFFATIGILPAIKKHIGLSIGLMLVNLFYLFVLLFGLLIGQDYAFDPMRIIEFLVYPNALFASFGFFYLIDPFKNRVKSIVSSMVMGLLIISGIFIYPPVFIFHNQIPADSPLFDVRSYLRYVPEEGIASMKWGEKNEMYVLQNSPSYTTLRNTLYPVVREQTMKTVVTTLPVKVVANGSTEEFVAGLYRTVLYREPDIEGFKYWVSQIDNEGVSRESAANYFKTTPEKKVINEPILISRYDYEVLNSFDKVKYIGLGVKDPEGLINNSKGKNKVYSNGWGEIYLGGSI